MMQSVDAQPSPAALSAGDLAELMASFNEVTARLEHTHTQLKGEVGRLNTELRQANEALQRSKRLAALGEMAAGISHEIRNPLGSIRLYAKMLEEDLGEMPEQREVAEKIARAVRGLDGVVSDVLTFARELKVQRSACLVSDIVDASLDACSAQLVGIRVSRPTRDAHLACDAGMVQQALINIIRNAAEANRSVGSDTLTIEIESGTISERESVLIRVRDQGDGMPEEVIGRMFNPFFTTRATGTGLGLAIVHRMIDAHDGQVVVYNNADREPGSQGATIELHLPADVLVADNKAVRNESGAVGEIIIKSAHPSQLVRVEKDPYHV